ncbi:hypothetical protein KM043_018877 [Ampulex compressa]|nr:hypothetical protein KM043_018877 [Ampulex compressa]
MSTSGKSISGKSIIIEQIPSHVKTLEKETSLILFSYFFYYKNHPEWNPKEDLSILRKSEKIEKITWDYHKNSKNHAHLLAYHDSPHSLDYIQVITGQKRLEEINESNLAIALRPDDRIVISRPREIESETSNFEKLRPPHKKQFIENPHTAKELEKVKLTNYKLGALVNKYFDEGLTLRDRAIEEVESRDEEINRLHYSLQKSQDEIKQLTEKLRVKEEQISQFDIEKLKLEQLLLEQRTDQLELQKNNDNSLALLEQTSQVNLEHNNLIKILEARNLHLENESRKNLLEKQAELSNRHDEICVLRRNLQEIEIEKQKNERQNSTQIIEQKYLQDQIKILREQIQTYQEQIKKLEGTVYTLQSQIITQEEYLKKESIETQDQFKTLQEQNARKQEQLIDDLRKNYDLQFNKQINEKTEEFNIVEQRLIKEKEQLEETIAKIQDILNQKEQYIENLKSSINNLKQIHQQEMTTLTITKDRTNGQETKILKEEINLLRQELGNNRDQMRNLEAMIKGIIEHQESQTNSQRRRKPPSRPDRNQFTSTPHGNPDDDDPDDSDNDDDENPHNRDNYQYRPRRVPRTHDLLPSQNAPAKETIDIVPIFTGDTAEGAVNISEWITKVDRARRWTKPNQHSLLLEKILTMKIKGRAQSCISNVDIYTYDQLKDVLIKRVNPTKSSLLLMNEITACIHNQGTIQEHNIKFRRNYTSWLNAKRLELKQAHQTDEAISIFLQISDKDIIQTYMQNLKEDTRAYLRTKDIYSLAQAEATAQEHEDLKRSIQRQRGMFRENPNERKSGNTPFYHEKTRNSQPHGKGKFFSLHKPKVHHTKYEENESQEDEDETIEENREHMTEQEQRYRNDIRQFHLDSISTIDQMKEAFEYVMVMNHPDRKCNHCKRPGHTELYCNQKKKDNDIPSPFNKVDPKKKCTQKGNQNFRRNHNQKRPPQQKVNTAIQEQGNTSDEENIYDESTSQQ